MNTGAEGQKGKSEGMCLQRECLRVEEELQRGGAQASRGEMRSWITGGLGAEVQERS